MKIAFTGGFTGGHFYPIIAVAQALGKELEENNYYDIEYYYISDDPYNQGILDNYKIKFVPLATGKARMYFSIKNFFDIFKTIGAIYKALRTVYKIFPDVIFSKGGYSSFPVVVAARFFNIPVIIHESDSRPGRANKFAGKFAEKVAVSYPETAKYFPKDTVAVTGQPIRREVLNPIVEDAHKQLGLDPSIPTIFIMGGSQGAKFINDAILKIAPKLIDKFQIVQQVGEKNIDEFYSLLKVALYGNENANRYKIFGYLDVNHMRLCSGVADIIVSRAGSTLFEIAHWGKPSIIIPITKSNGDHQRQNAYIYARAGACKVIEEENMTPILFATEVNKLISDKEKLNSMSEAALKFSTENAAEKIAKQIMIILKNHGK